MENSGWAAATSNETVLRVGPLELDLNRSNCKARRPAIDLRPREFQLLKYMMERSDHIADAGHPLQGSVAL